MKFLKSLTPRHLFATGLTVAVCGAFLFLLVGPVEAVDTGLKTTAGKAGLDNVGTNVYSTIGGIINVVLGLVGILFLMLMIYAGYLWMTAQGSNEQVSKAKSMIVQATIGLVVILSSYALADYVITELLRATTGQITAPPAS